MTQRLAYPMLFPPRPAERKGPAITEPSINWGLIQSELAANAAEIVYVAPHLACRSVRSANCERFPGWCS